MFHALADQTFKGFVRATLGVYTYKKEGISASSRPEEYYGGIITAFAVFFNTCASVHFNGAFYTQHL